MKWMIRLEPRRCRGCLICELRCSLRHGDGFSPSEAFIEVRRVLGREEEFSLSLKEGCDGCGICARFCPYGAIILEER